MKLTLILVDPEPSVRTLGEDIQLIVSLILLFFFLFGGYLFILEQVSKVDSLPFKLLALVQVKFDDSV